ncbi:hypothetical protein JI752_009625 [Lysobacter sp. MMG2]|uniref:TubC N-terminal docking domain-related protein n=1 Tax=Lysobacter sp. MMG2 TaxID=2801338 RepID=UPI001C231F4E|nr:hypothetical protein [Lysobacter sp. MMG2]MBU8976396.1 hypothetical protein [Lysobacter sp. MMG2]
MTAATFLRELRGRGVRLALHGDGLRVEAKFGTLRVDLRERLTVAKPELIVLLLAELRARMLSLAADDPLLAERVNGLDDTDVAACDGLDDDTLRAYLWALQRSAQMDAGGVPIGYTQVVNCDGCGPVWLWPESPVRVIACPWCFRRKAGRLIPRPPLLRYGKGEAR